MAGLLAPGSSTPCAFPSRVALQDLPGTVVGPRLRMPDMLSLPYSPRTIGAPQPNLQIQLRLLYQRLSNCRKQEAAFFCGIHPQSNQKRGVATLATVQTKYLGDLRTESVHLQSGNKLITDAPTDNQGRGEAFSPTDLLATAFGACVLTIMGIAAKTHGFDINGTEVETTKVMGTEPRRIVELITSFKFPHNNFSAKQKKILELTAKECPVFNSLHPDIKKTVTYIYPE